MRVWSKAAKCDPYNDIVWLDNMYERADELFHGRCDDWFAWCKEQRRCRKIALERQFEERAKWNL